MADVEQVFIVTKVTTYDRENIAVYSKEEDAKKRVEQEENKNDNPVADFEYESWGLIRNVL